MNMNDYFELEYLRQMYKRLGCLPVLLLCFTFSFVGCKTIKESEIVEIHDTLTVHHSDTVREYKLKTLYDTVHQFTERLVTLNEAGDVVKEVNNHYYHEKVVEKDSTDKYKSTADSLRAVLNQLREKETISVKSPNWWEQWKWRLVSCALLVALVLALLPMVKRIVARIKRP